MVFLSCCPSLAAGLASRLRAAAQNWVVLEHITRAWHGRTLGNNVNSSSALDYNPLPTASTTILTVRTFPSPQVETVISISVPTVNIAEAKNM